MHRHHWRRAWRHQRNLFDCAPELAYAGWGADIPHAREMYSSRREEESVFGGGSLGTRRPLRFLTHRLDLTREQVNEASRVLERLKIEREQAAVDLRRAAADLADAFDGETFESGRAEAAAAKRVEAASSVQRAVTVALRELHELLDDEQRARLATLIRTRAIRL